MQRPGIQGCRACKADLAKARPPAQFFAKGREDSDSSWEDQLPCPSTEVSTLRRRPGKRASSGYTASPTHTSNVQKTRFC